MTPRELHPGDLVLFCNRTLRQAGLMSWLADVVTLIMQRLLTGTAQGAYCGFQQFCHVGIIVRWQGVLHLLEWMPGGMYLRPAEARLREHNGRIVIAPLNADALALWDETAVCQWIEPRRCYRYRWGGLLFCLLHWLLGAPAPGAYFCSEAVATLLQHLSIIPQTLQVCRRGEMVEGNLFAHTYSPSELAAITQTQRQGMYTWRPTFTGVAG